MTEIQSYYVEIPSHLRKLKNSTCEPEVFLVWKKEQHYNGSDPVEIKKDVEVEVEILVKTNKKTFLAKETFLLNNQKFTKREDDYLTTISGKNLDSAIDACLSILVEQGAPVNQKKQLSLICNGVPSKYVDFVASSGVKQGWNEKIESEKNRFSEHGSYSLQISISDPESEMPTTKEAVVEKKRETT